MMRAEVRLNRGAGSAGKDSAEESAKATRKLERTESGRRVRTGGLDNPDKEVDRRAKDLLQERRIEGSGVDGLGKEVGHNVAGEV